MLLKKCNICNKYTLKEECSICNKKSKEAHYKFLKLKNAPKSEEKDN
jgi:recombinational DNA repair protein RecR